MKSFHVNAIESDDLSFELVVPLDVDGNNSIPVLLEYIDGEGRFEKVKDQGYDKKTNSIEATVEGGYYIVQSSKDFNSSLKKDKSLKELNKSAAIKDLKQEGKKIKFLDLPNFELSASELKDITMKNDDEIVTIKDAIVVKSGEKEATYKVKSLFKDLVSGETYATIEASSSETDNVPVVFIHGLSSSPSGAWGIDMYWDNVLMAKSEESIGLGESYTGNTYLSEEYEPYTNVDVHFIEGISNDGEMADDLRDAGYVVNKELFTFQYYANGHVGDAGEAIDDFINGIRNNVFGDTRDVNIIAHSKGGLVSRYAIEANSQSSNIDRLITFGTPHFGVNNSSLGDLDRYNSVLWQGNDSDPYCEPLNGESHINTNYYLFAGMNQNLYYIDNSAEDQYHEVPLRNDVSITDANSYHTWLAANYKADPSLDYGDGYVSLDSGLGSDLDPQSPQEFSNVDVTKKWLWIGVDGGHSDFKKLPRSTQLVQDILDGEY